MDAPRCGPPTTHAIAHLSLGVDIQTIIRADRRVIRLLELADQVHIPAGALAQAWRNPARQVPLVRAMVGEGVTLHPMDDDGARAAGRPCAATVSRTWWTHRWSW